MRVPPLFQALVEYSRYCFQELKMVCLNAPITQRVNYSTCDGVTQTGELPLFRFRNGYFLGFIILQQRSSINTCEFKLLLICIVNRGKANIR